MLTMPVSRVYINMQQLPKTVIHELTTCFGNAIEHTPLTVRELREEHGHDEEDAIVVRYRRSRYYVYHVYHLPGPPNAFVYPCIEALCQLS
jgi:hypothetical protein